MPGKHRVELNFKDIAAKLSQFSKENITFFHHSRFESLFHNLYFHCEIPALTSFLLFLSQLTLKHKIVKRTKWHSSVKMYILGWEWCFSVDDVQLVLNFHWKFAEIGFALRSLNYTVVADESIKTNLSRVAFSKVRSFSMTGSIPSIRNSNRRWIRNSRCSCGEKKSYLDNYTSSRYGMHRR